VWGRAPSPVQRSEAPQPLTAPPPISACDFCLYSHITMCTTLHMPTNLALDDRLIEAARQAGKHKTKKEAVTAALDEYVRRRKQMRILDAFGTVTFDPSYDYRTTLRCCRCGCTCFTPRHREISNAMFYERAIHRTGKCRPSFSKSRSEVTSVA
jgi:Arc/MetJ family transcription regulator